MIAVLAVSFLIALILVGVVIIIAKGCISSLQFSTIHGLAMLICMAVSTFFLSAAIQSYKITKSLDRGEETVGYYTGLLDILMGDDLDLQLSQMADDAVHSFMANQRKELKETRIWCIVVIVVVNSLLLILLLMTGKNGPAILSSRHRPIPSRHEHRPVSRRKRY